MRLMITVILTKHKKNVIIINTLAGNGTNKQSHIYFTTFAEKYLFKVHIFLEENLGINAKHFHKNKIGEEINCVTCV